MGKKEAEAVIDLCGLRNFVNDLDEGMYTQLPPNGLGLAQSIRTRVLMARCLIGNHCLLLIEDTWQDVARETRKQWTEFLLSDATPTVLMATNDKEVLEQMDRVYTLHNGRLVEK